MKFNELKQHIEGMEAGQYARISYDVFGDLFPPCVEDDRAKENCYNFAKSLGCRVENKPQDEAVWIVKDA